MLTDILDTYPKIEELLNKPMMQTIDKMRAIFVRHGTPSSIHSTWFSVLIMSRPILQKLPSSPFYLNTSKVKL